MLEYSPVMMNTAIADIIFETLYDQNNAKSVPNRYLKFN